MLVQFAVENFMSFHQKIVFSLRALDGSPTSSAYFETNGLRLLKCAAIYGANASGKSNLVRALRFGERLVLSGTANNKKIPVKRFRLDPNSTNMPSQFEYELLISGVMYSYGFRIDPTTVLEEWLFRTVAGGEEELMFERRLDESRPENALFEFGPGFSVDESRIQFLKFIGEGTRRNQLFLHEAVERNATELAPIFDWFRQGLHVIGPESLYASLVSRIDEEPGFRTFLSSYLSSADTGISGLTTKKSEIELPPELADGLSGMASPFQFKERMLTKEEGKWVSLRIQSYHKSSSGKRVRFSIEDESDGTRRLMHLAPALHSVSDGAHTFVIDELDRSLHPLLTRKFILDFLSRSQGSQEQMIFTTHDTNLLARELLPADAVWFVEKDEAGCSQLYSLAEFNQEQLKQLGDTIEAGYLKGRFGAIPFFADRKKLGWAQEDS